MAFYGIDLHSDSFLVSYLAIEDGKLGTVKNTKYYLDEASFQKFKECLTSDDYVVVEATTNAFWFHDQISSLVNKCYVLDVSKFQSEGNKTDKIDGKKLVKKLAFFILACGDQTDFPTVFIPPTQIRELRALFTTYQLNKKSITQFKNRIHSILKQNGICIPRKEISKPSFETKINQFSLSQVWEFQIKTLLQQVNMLEEQTKVIKTAIYKNGYRLFPKEVEILLTTKGFSLFTAIALMTDVIDIDRFSCAKKFCAYLRTSPRVKSSNKTTKIGPTNRNSRPLSCSLLSQSVDHFAKAGGYLSSFYARIKVGKKPGVYRMAMIRKILVCSYNMLKNKEHFYWIDEKLYQTKLKELHKILNDESRLIA